MRFPTMTKHDHSLQLGRVAMACLARLSFRVPAAAQFWKPMPNATMQQCVWRLRALQRWTGKLGLVISSDGGVSSDGRNSGSYLLVSS